MQDYATKKIVELIRLKGIPVSVIAHKTDLSTGILYPVFQGSRTLRAEEFIKVCKCLEVDPLSFYNNILDSQ